MAPLPVPLFGLESVQWELNPHFRHGKAVGYRYIMDAVLFLVVLIVRLRSEGLEPSPVRLRAGNAAANTSISWLIQWGRRDSNPRCAG